MGKQQLIVGSVAKALEIIPRQICDNAGLDATDVLNKLRMRHAQGDIWCGVDVESEGVQDNMKKFVWEPALVKTNALSSAIDAACLILSVDETVRNPQSEVSSYSSLIELKLMYRLNRLDHLCQGVRHRGLCEDEEGDEEDRDRRGSCRYYATLPHDLSQLLSALISQGMAVSSDEYIYYNNPFGMTHADLKRW
jgi:T-complex protein 1 subunit eta